jgi:hypothetical protein
MRNYRFHIPYGKRRACAITIPARHRRQEPPEMTGLPLETTPDQQLPGWRPTFPTSRPLAHRLR